MKKRIKVFFNNTLTLKFAFIMTRTFHFALLLSLFSAIGLHAQTRPNAVKLGVGYSETAYEGAGGLLAELQYDRRLNNRFTLTAGLGLLNGTYVMTGSSMGTDAMGSWDNSYELKLNEQFNYLEANALYSFFPVEQRNDLKFGIGLAYAQAILDYPVDVFIRKGIVETSVIEPYTRYALMMNFVLENDFHLNDRWIAGIKATFRTTFSEKDVLERTINYPDGFQSSTSGILNNAGITARIGYQL
jgi:hypothetical protein